MSTNVEWPRTVTRRMVTTRHPHGATVTDGSQTGLQGLFMGSVVSVIVTMLRPLNFLEEPFQDVVGGLQPAAVERAELLIDQQPAVIGDDIPIPRDPAGNPT